MTKPSAHPGSASVPMVIALAIGGAVATGVRWLLVRSTATEASAASAAASPPTDAASAAILSGEAFERYLGNDFCLGITALGLAALIYALLQLWGLSLDRRAAEQRAGGGATRLLCYVTGRDPNHLGGMDLTASAGKDVMLRCAEVSDVWEAFRARRASFLTYAIWALPLLGFIGTVVGISGAIGGLGDVFASNERDAALAGVLSSLQFAFDTTLIGLVAVLPTMAAAHMLKIRSDETRQLLIARVMSAGR